MIRVARRGRMAQLRGMAEGLQGGTLRLYTGPLPESPDDPPSVEAALLAELPVATLELSDDGWLRFPVRGTGRVLGSIRWFQALAADGEVLLDGSAGRTSGALIVPIDLVQPGAPISMVCALAAPESAEAA